MKYLLLILVLPLLISAAPAPARCAICNLQLRNLQSIAETARDLHIQLQGAQVDCTEQLARQAGAPYLHEIISDARGYPIGDVAAWSCAGDVTATITEFQQRKAALIGGAR